MGHKCVKCQHPLHKKGVLLCDVCKEEVDNLKGNAKLSLVGIGAAVVLGTVLWFWGVPAFSCWTDQWSLSKDTEYVLIKGRCKINMGTEASPNWIWIDKMRGYSSGEVGE